MSMFRRKDENDVEGIDFDGTPAGNNDSTMSAMKPATPASPMPVSAMPATPAPAPRPAAPATATGFRPSTPQTSAPAPMAPQPQAKPNTNTATPVPAGANAKGGKRILTVGNDILLKGEIATCDRLVIEGSVDATLKDVHTVEIAETGSFKGTAEIEDAEISGLFEGELIVRNRLTVYSTGRVRGTIAYGEIEIERGGTMTGTISIGSPKDSAKSEAKKAA